MTMENKSIYKQLRDHFKESPGESCRVTIGSGESFWVDPNENGGYLVQPLFDLDHYMNAGTLFEAAWITEHWDVKRAKTVNQLYGGES